MDWFLQMLFFGILAFGMLTLSVGFAEAKRYRTGMLFGVLELLSAAISSKAWMYALRANQQFYNIE